MPARDESNITGSIRESQTCKMFFGKLRVNQCGCHAQTHTCQAVTPLAEAIRRLNAKYGTASRRSPGFALDAER
jgi:hypothetical protein